MGRPEVLSASGTDVPTHPQVQVLNELLQQGKVAKFEKLALRIITEESEDPNTIYNTKLILSKMYMKMGLHDLSLKYLPEDQKLAHIYQRLFIDSKRIDYECPKNETMGVLVFISTDWTGHPCGKFLSFVDYIPGALKIDPKKEDIKESLLKLELADTIIDCNGFTHGSITNYLIGYSNEKKKRLVTYLGYPVQVPGVQYLEESYFKDSFFLCYDIPKVIPSIKPRGSTGQITYGYFARMEKMNESTIAHFITLIQETLSKGRAPRIKVRSKYFFHPQVKALFLSRIPEEYRPYVELVESTEDYYDSFNEIDYLIDSYPYSGTTITCDSLYMGVPIIINPEVKDTDSLHTTVTKRLLSYLGILHGESMSREELRSLFINKMCNPEKFAKDFLRALLPSTTS